MNQEAKFQIRIKVNDMYRFLMRHAYIGISGIINLVISGGAFVLFLLGVGNNSGVSNTVLLLIAALFTVINPLYLYYKAAKQVKLTPMFLKPLDYVVNESGIFVSQGEEKLTIEWEQIRKVIETKQDFYIYLSVTRAYILPKAQYESQVETVKALIKKHVEMKQCKLRN